MTKPKKIVKKKSGGQGSADLSSMKSPSAKQSKPLKALQRRTTDGVTSYTSRSASSTTARGPSSGATSGGSLSKLRSRPKRRPKRERTTRCTVAPGDSVVYTWTVDPAYGGGTRQFSGVVSGVSGDFARLTNSKNEAMAVYLPTADIKVV